MANGTDPIAAWRGIVDLVRSRAEGRSDAQLDHRPDAQSMTLRETVHHVAEANVVAASIVIAALGSPGCVYDWSWMLPFGPWMERMRYAEKPLAPTMRLLEALNEYVIAQLAPLRDGLRREVQLVDEPGKPPRRTTVGDVLLAEAAHAREHLADAG